jgi:hypothetical protein
MLIDAEILLGKGNCFFQRDDNSSSVSGILSVELDEHKRHVNLLYIDRHTYGLTMTMS